MPEIIVRRFIKYGGKKTVYVVTGTMDYDKAKEAVARLNKTKLSTSWLDYKAEFGKLGMYEGQEAVGKIADNKHNGSPCIIVWKGGEL